MLFKALVTLLFGSEWKLKQRIEAARHPRARQLMIKLWGALQYECGSSVAWNASFAGEPCFPHGIKSIFISGAATVGRNAVIRVPMFCATANAVTRVRVGNSSW